MGLPWLFLLLDRGAGSTSWALIQLVVINPVLFVVGSIRSWFRYSWKSLITPAAYSVAFVVCVFTVYNVSALPYLVVYVALVAVVWLVVVLVSRLARREQ